MKKAMKALVAATVIGLFLAAVWVTTGIHFETNDDRYITEILSGTMFGHSDAHVIFINYLLALPLSLLYRLSVQIPWYGGMLILFHALSYCLFLRSLYDRCRSFFEMGAATAAVCCCMLVNICMTAEIQFTSTAVLMAVSGYAVLLLQRNEKMGVCLFFVMELLAYFLRSHAMLMIQPLGGVVYLLLCLMENRENLRSGWIRIAKWLAVIVSIFVIGLCGTAIGYHGREWAEYNRFNKVRSELLDYYGMPEYGEVQDILDRYGVTETEYTAFCRYVIIDREVPAECLEEIAEYMETQHPLAVHADEIRQNLLEIWRNNRFMEVCVLFALGYLLLRRRWGLLLPFGGVLTVYTALLIYLYAQGRTPQRVLHPLMTGVLFLFIAVLFRDLSENRTGRKMGCLLLLLLVLPCWYCVKEGKQQWHREMTEAGYQDAYIEGLREVHAYCVGHPESFYLLDAWSFCYYRGSVLQTDIYGVKNCVVDGGWISNSPPMIIRLTEQLNREQDVFMVISDDAMAMPESVVAFWEEKTGKQAEVSERFTVSHGGSYFVYRLK